MVAWVVIPAPNRHFWLLSVGVGEWSLWFGVLALLCIVSAVVIRLLNGAGWLWIATAVIGAAVIVITLYPLFSVLPLARKYKIPLSFRRYFTGWPAKDFFFGYQAKDFKTRTFHSAEGTDLHIDVYLPTAQSANNGASVIVVHGGSWNGGARSDFPRWNEWLADQGFTVFDVDYRLSPQPNYLTATGDVKAAVRWVKRRAAEFGIDPGRIALLGRSAGAHLALLAAYSAPARIPATAAGVDNENENIRAVVSFYGPVDLLWAYECRGKPRVHDGPGSLENFLGGVPHESVEMRERYVLTSPVAHIGAHTPPTLMTHGGRDLLVSYKNMFFLEEKLKAANVPHETLFIPYGQHGFDYHLGGWGSQVVGSVLLRFLSEHTKVDK
jgi:acetyl esterase/lipase